VSVPASILLRHNGPFTSEVIVACGRELRALPDLSEDARHRLFATFVELAQNIARYSVERAGPPGGERGAGEVTVSAAEGRLLVAASNLVSPAAAAALADQIAALKELDAAALRVLHRDRRRAPPPPGSLGAGLGLIEMARNASAPLAHNAEPRADGLIRFTFLVPLASVSAVSKPT